MRCLLCVFYMFGVVLSILRANNDWSRLLGNQVLRSTTPFLFNTK